MTEHIHVSTRVICLDYHERNFDIRVRFVKRSWKQFSEGTDDAIMDNVIIIEWPYGKIYQYQSINWYFMYDDAEGYS